MLNSIANLYPINAFSMPTVFFGGDTPPEPEYATINPADKDANITLSNGNLTMTSDNTARKSARSTIGKSSGKWYWEVTVGPSAGADYVIGVGTSAANINSYCGDSAVGRGYYSNGGSSAKVNNNSFDAGYGAAVYVNGDVIGVALDMDAGTISFYCNGAPQGQAYSGLTGEIFSMSSIYETGSNFTINYGASAFAYSVPGGFNSGLYT